MAAWTVMTPPGDAALEDAVFIREGFSWVAAVFGPFWALVNRMWIVAIILAVAGILAGLLPPALAAVANVGLLLVAGLFGSDLRLWSLTRRGFTEAAQLRAASREEAEARFFAAHPLEQRAEPAPLAPLLRPEAATAADPLGLFGKGW